jgi:hypothetical protein
MTQSRLRRRFDSAFRALLFIDFIRLPYGRMRWLFLRGKLRFLEKTSTTEGVGEETVSHNLDALLHSNAAFGMAKRMSLLLFPLAAVLKDRLGSARVLIVGPRTEDDIFWARSLGLQDTTGLDLFSYSKHIGLGDIHNSGLSDNSYDAVLLGWMLSYSSQPETVVQECKRMLKPGGYLGIGIESNALQDIEGVRPPRVNALNSTADLIGLVDAPVVFSNEPYEKITYDCGVLFKVLKS